MLQRDPQPSLPRPLCMSLLRGGVRWGGGGVRTPGPLESRANPGSSSGTATSQQRGLGRDLLPSESLSHLETAASLPTRYSPAPGARKGTLSRRFLYQGALRGCPSQARCRAAWQEVYASAEATARRGGEEERQ